MQRWETSTTPATHWCPLCSLHVEPLWMLVANAGTLVPYHLNGMARHAVTATAGHDNTPAVTGRELIELLNGVFVTYEPV